MLIVAFQTSMKAQQTDENTFIINKYFQISNNKTVVNKSEAPKANFGSYINLVQAGQNNNIYVNALQNDIQNVQQIGNQNNYQYFSSYNSIQSNITVNQEGLLNSLQIFGENSLMKDVVINQKSDFKSMVIKNYTN